MFIIDKTCMIPINAFCAIYRCLQGITSVNIAFGGKIILLGGVFRLVLPVVPRGKRTARTEFCIETSIV